MKRFRVVTSPPVEDQIREQLAYIAKDSIINAINWESRLRKYFAEIGEMPGSHQVNEEATSQFVSKVHKAVFEGTYLIHYLVDAHAEMVEILNFRHGVRLPRQNEP